MLGFRKIHIDTLQQQLSSLDAKLECPTSNAVNGKGEIPTTNTHHELQSGGFVCRQPGCAAARENTVFNTRSELEYEYSYLRVFLHLV